MSSTMRIFRRYHGLWALLIVGALTLGNLPPVQGATIPLGAPALSALPPVERAAEAPVQQLNGPDAALQYVSAISAGYFHTCALLASGAVQCWGAGYLTGSGVAGNVQSPRNVEGTFIFKQISASDNHTCAVTTSGNVMCWGENHYGQLGVGDSDEAPTPVQVIDLYDVASVTAGTNFTCALTIAGDVWCWGRNHVGQLGNTSAGSFSLVPLMVPGLSGVQAVEAGGDNVCVITSAGAAKCWGKANGILGMSSGDAVATPQDVPFLSSDVSALALGGGFACAIVSSSAQCWGENMNGELGRGYTSATESIPIVANGMSSGVTAITANDSHACAVQDGALKCWGVNEDGEIGDGTKTDRTEPVQVAGLSSGVAGASAGEQHTCAVMTDGTARCWGSSFGGRLGTGGNSPTSPPVRVSALSGIATQVDAGFNHSCAIVDGAAYCWGAGTSGQLGNGLDFDRSEPVMPTGLTSAVSHISAGGAHSCAEHSTVLKCWGAGGSGRLGNGGTTNSNVPVEVGPGNIASVAAGDFHTCAIDAGEAGCWGFGGNGRLGNGGTANQSTPVAVSGLSPDSSVYSVSAGGDHTCAMVFDIETDTELVYCWGANSLGQLGDGGTVDVLTFVQTKNSAGDGVLEGAAVQVSAGNGFTCANVDGAAYCWGTNFIGQLGNGSENQSNLPVAVQGLSSGVTSISAGDSHGCAVVNGGVKCWGDNYYGQLGNSTLVNSLVPVDVPGLPPGANQVSAGGTGSCAIIGGNVWCWGANDRGQTGTAPYLAPQTVAAGEAPPYKLSITIAGGGIVELSPTAIDCWESCEALFLPGENVNLTSTPFTDGALLDWGGACVGTALSCQVTMNSDKAFTISFKEFYKLTVNTVGNGKVVSTPERIDCAGTCIVYLAEGSSFNITAIPFAGQHFVEWTGACAGEDETCTVFVTEEEQETTAVFAPNAFTLQVNRTGDGSVRINPGDNLCGSTTCSLSYLEGVSATITALPDAGWAFGGWTGACTGTTNPCTVSMTAARTVNATFVPLQYALATNVTGAGHLTIAPGDLYCFPSAPCSNTFLHGASVTITAKPDPGWAFNGWTGACAGTSTTCTVSMVQARNVGAAFVYVNNALDEAGITVESGFAYPQDAPHIFGKATYSGTVDAEDTLLWLIHEGAPNATAALTDPAGSGPFRITPDGELILNNPGIALGEHIATVSLTDARGSTISREITVTVSLRVFAPLIDSK